MSNPAVECFSNVICGSHACLLQRTSGVSKGAYECCVSISWLQGMLHTLDCSVLQTCVFDKLYMLATSASQKTSPQNRFWKFATKCLMHSLCSTPFFIFTFYCIFPNSFHESTTIPKSYTNFYFQILQVSYMDNCLTSTCILNN